MTQEQLAQFAKQMVALAAIFNPGAAASVELLIAAATQLNEMVASIKRNDPDMWDKVSKDYKDSLAAFDASVPKA